MYRPLDRIVNATSMRGIVGTPDRGRAGPRRGELVDRGEPTP